MFNCEIRASNYSLRHKHCHLIYGHIHKMTYYPKIQDMMLKINLYLNTLNILNFNYRKYDMIFLIILQFKQVFKVSTYFEVILTKMAQLEGYGPKIVPQCSPKHAVFCPVLLVNFFNLYFYYIYEGRGSS